MIKQLTVKNWKSFEEAIFYIDPLTILIGANASGKSNLLDAAGTTMVPFLTVVHRDDKTGASILTPLEEIDQLPKLIAGSSLGGLYTQRKIEKALKMTDSLVDEPSAAVKKQKRKPPVELKEKVTECGSIMSSAPLSEWGIETS